MPPIAPLYIWQISVVFGGFIYRFIFPRNGMAALKEYVIFIAFPPNQRLHESA
jgi:hypothetical protein